MGFFTLLANFLGAVEYKYKFLRFFKEHLSHIPKNSWYERLMISIYSDLSLPYINLILSRNKISH